MNRYCRTVLGLVVVFLAAGTSMLQAQSSVPNLLSFQGRLSNAGGPAADGPHDFTFQIYDSLAGGTSRWSEGPVALTTSGGLFTHQLGSVVSLPQTLFQDYDQLYLEIEADGEIQSPRIRLITTPYTRVANSLEVRNTTNDTVVIRTLPGSSQLSTYGSDGKEQIRLWGPSWGEILLHDEDATNDQTVDLSANVVSGGALILGDDNGAARIDLLAGLTGDGSVTLPGDAINALETKDEAGVASDAVNRSIIFLNLDGTIQTLQSRSITAPAAGYVLAIATVDALSTHTNGATSWANFGVSNAAGVFPLNQDFQFSVPATAASGSYARPVTVHGLFSVGAGLSTFYFLGREGGGNYSVGDGQLTLIYFPTAYGTVVPTVAATQSISAEGSAAGREALTASDIAAERDEAEAFNAARIERELAEVKARMTKLEEQIHRNQVVSQDDK